MTGPTKAVLPLVAAGLVVAGWYGGPLIHPTSAPPETRRAAPRIRVVGPVALSAAQLRAEVRFLRQPFFWAGPRPGYRYELTRTTPGYVYVRYLPRGVRAGASGSSFLIVATYPFPGAYKALTRVARGKEIAGPGGSIVFVRPKDPKSVLLAFPRVDYEIEVSGPSPAVAAAVAESGRVRPVG